MAISRDNAGKLSPWRTGIQNNQDVHPNIAGNLRTLRQRRGLSLETLASLSGVSRAMLGQIETGKSIPTVTSIWKISRALGVQASDLIDGRSQECAIVFRPQNIPFVEETADGLRKRVFGAPYLRLPYDVAELTLNPAQRLEIAARQDEAWAMLRLPGAHYRSWLTTR